MQTTTQQAPTSHRPPCYGVLGYRVSNNLGDEIQTFAAERFLPRVDVVLDREYLDAYARLPPTSLIANGWFLHPEGSWPPPKNLSPLFTSFYIEEHRRPDLLQAESLAYLREHGPIGCRSTSTVDALTSRGIESYFSGCLTLTLQRPQVDRTDNIYLVDLTPEQEATLLPESLRRSAIHLTHIFRPDDTNLGLKVWDRFQSRVVERILPRSHFLSQAGGRLVTTWKDRIKRQAAAQLLNCYAGAKLVVTSRLHCFLPCLAFGTPVVLIKPGVHESPRFAGLKELGMAFDGTEPHLPDVLRQNHFPSREAEIGKIREQFESGISRWLRQIES